MDVIFTLTSRWRHADRDERDGGVFRNVELIFAPDRRLFGVGAAPSIVEATFGAVLSALARATQQGWLESPGPARTATLAS